MNYFSEIMEKTSKWKYLGERTTENGALLIGHVPHVGGQAYLHVFHKPLTDTEINDVQQGIPVKIPLYYKEFLKYTNGVHFFSGSLSLFGLRVSWGRDVEERQPFCIKGANNEERPKDAKPNMFFFGFYKWDGSLLFGMSDSNMIYRCQGDNLVVLNEWCSFEQMILSEYDRMSILFDNEGKRDKKTSTVPLACLCHRFV